MRSAVTRTLRDRDPVPVVARNKHKSPLLLLAVQVYGKEGGVPAYTRRIAEILTHYASQQHRILNCVSFDDTENDPTRHRHPVHYEKFEGTRLSRSGFLLRSIAIARSYPGAFVVVAHLGQAPVAWILRRLGLIRKYVVALHGVEAWDRVGRLDRIALIGASAIIATTRFTAAQFGRVNQIPESLLRVIPLALDADEIPPPPPAAERPGPLRVLSVGRLAGAERYKGFEYLIEAVALLRKRDIPVTLDVVGGGDDLTRLAGLRDELNLGPFVQLPGEVGRDRLAVLFAECDVFALPSKGEGFGIVFLEAMSFGKPCIGGNHGGTPEVIEPGKTGFLVPHGDAAIIAEHLEALYRNPELRRSMGQSAYETVRSKYRFERMRDQWCALLTELESSASKT